MSKTELFFAAIAIVFGVILIDIFYSFTAGSAKNYLEVVENCDKTELVYRTRSGNWRPVYDCAGNYKDVGND